MVGREIKALEGSVDLLGAIATSTYQTHHAQTSVLGNDIANPMPWSDGDTASPSLARRLEIRNVYTGILARGGHVGC